MLRIVAGLMTGACVLKARAQIRGEFVVVPSVAFKSDEAVMLDGMTHAELERRMGRVVRPVDFAAFSRMLVSPATPAPRSAENYLGVAKNLD